MTGQTYPATPYLRQLTGRGHRGSAVTATIRMTVHTQVVLHTLLADATTDLYGLEIADRTGLLPGTTYPILARLQRIGWVRARWEDIDPHDEQRPRRRYYHLTPDGAAAARDALASRQRGNDAAGPAGPDHRGDAAMTVLRRLHDRVGGLRRGDCLIVDGQYMRVHRDSNG